MSAARTPLNQLDVLTSMANGEWWRATTSDIPGRIPNNTAWRLHRRGLVDREGVSRLTRTAGEGFRYRINDAGRALLTQEAMPPCGCCRIPYERRGADDPWQGRLNGYCDECSWARCDTSDVECPNRPSRKMKGRSRGQLRASLIAARRQQRRNDENVRLLAEENAVLRAALQKHWTWGQYERSLADGRTPSESGGA